MVQLVQYVGSLGTHSYSHLTPCWGLWAQIRWIRVSMGCVCVCEFNSDSWFVVSTPGDCVSLTYWIKKLYMYPVLTIFVYLRVFFVGLSNKRAEDS